MNTIAGPAIELPAGQQTTFRITPALADGNTLADWASFVMTIREDPGWPRECVRDKRELTGLDPVNENWPVFAEVPGSIVTVSGVEKLLFPVVLPTTPGDNRFVLDAVGLGGSLGRVTLYRLRWLSLYGNATEY